MSTREIKKFFEGISPIGADGLESEVMKFMQNFRPETENEMLLMEIVKLHEKRLYIYGKAIGDMQEQLLEKGIYVGDYYGIDEDDNVEDLEDYRKKDK